jgi:predicted N-acetyltransferase YhbS
MLVRRATIADSAAILDCLRLAFEPYRERYTAPAFDDTVMSVHTIAQRLSDMSVLVALNDDGAIVGTIGYARVDH